MAVTDTTCGYPFPVEFLKMLASTLTRDKTTGDVLGFRAMFTAATSYCDCEPAIDCANNHVPPETLLIHGFGIDECGQLAIKLTCCDGSICDMTESCDQDPK